MIVSVWARHLPDCSHVGDPHYRQCACPKHLQWCVNGKQYRFSAKTRSWETATRKARQKEQELERAELGQPPKNDEPVTVLYAVEQYLADKRAQKLKEVTLKKLEVIFQKQLVSWCNAAGIVYLKGLTLPLLRQWRNTWEDGQLASKKKQERVRGFFNFCQSSGWIQDNAAKGLSRIKVDQAPTDYFTKEEFDKIIDATYVYDSKTVNAAEMQNNATRLRTLTWPSAMRSHWNGRGLGPTTICSSIAPRRARPFTCQFPPSLPMPCGISPQGRSRMRAISSGRVMASRSPQLRTGSVRIGSCSNWPT
jgi:integrase/recombinase XerD